MSDITEFFPAASGSGGGGGLVSDPRDLRATVSTVSNLQSKNGATGNISAAQAGFYNLFIGNGSSPSGGANGGLVSGYSFDFTGAAVNTYHTIADVTSPTNGGIMRFCLSPSINNTSTAAWSFKITVDGTAYELPGTMNNGSNSPSEPFISSIGGVKFGNPGTAVTLSSTMFQNNYYSYLSTATSTNTHAAINSGIYFAQRSLPTGYGVTPSYIDTDLSSLGGLRYKSSLKVELKINALGTLVTPANDRGIAVIQNFDTIN